MKSRPLASVSLDLDDLWSYMKTHGEPGWDAYPSYLDVAVPRILAFLEARRLTISFFVVGLDAERRSNATVMRAIADAGHEIGNHSHRHEPWLHLYSPRELEEELGRAEEAIFRATGERPRGFRGPGFSFSPATLEVLRQRGYAYDASVFPNALNPLARRYFFATSKLDGEERRTRRAMFGTWRDAFRPLRPFRWELGQGPLLEIPVTTMPLLRIPFHLSYVLYLARFSERAAAAYARTAFALCRLTGVEPSVLLHPLDFLAPAEAPQLAFFPGMDLPLETKLRVTGTFLDALTARFDPVTMAAHAEAVERRRAARAPAFSGTSRGVERKAERKGAAAPRLAPHRKLTPE